MEQIESSDISESNLCLSHFTLKVKRSGSAVFAYKLVHIMSSYAGLQQAMIHKLQSRLKHTSQRQHFIQNFYKKKSLSLFRNKTVLTVPWGLM